MSNIGPLLPQIIANIKSLLSLGKIAEAIKYMQTTVAPITEDLNNQITMQSGAYSRLLDEKDFMNGEDYRRQERIIARNLIGIADSIEDQIEIKRIVDSAFDPYSSIYTITSGDALEKIHGKGNNLVSIEWIKRAIEASKSVCQVLKDGKPHGTGWMMENGKMMTNWHVIPNTNNIDSYEIAFNYEDVLEGESEKVSKYKLKADGAIFSSIKEYDYALVEVIDEGGRPLSYWGHLKTAPDMIPEIDDRVSIIQHPSGRKKEIALTENQVINADKHKLFYLTDTEPGSSGSPVFNKDWKVVALHHAGKTEEDGGLVVDSSTGERKGANEGILIKNILDDIKAKQNA